MGYKEYLKSYLSIFNEANEEVDKGKIDVADGYSSEVYDEIKRFEDDMVENADLYEVFEAVNLVLKKPCYSPIQNMTPSIDVKNESIHIYGVTKDNCPKNEELLKQYVKDLKEYTKSKLKFKAIIDEEELDGLKKFQLKLTAKR